MYFRFPGLIQALIPSRSRFRYPQRIQIQACPLTRYPCPRPSTKLELKRYRGDLWSRSSFVTVVLI
jgi:hypothetical protein